LIESWPFYFCSADALVAIDLLNGSASIAAILTQRVELHVYALHVSRNTRVDSHSEGFVW